ncbi:MAG: rRNA pseudouridine synthase [Candidatus Omnitrophica bacterium]|nr:rRNA pseudouridine synthase [Candidatus Omnitrophota bacterium]
MRLQSFLAQSGVASRRNVIYELDQGKVKVNGEVVRIPSYPIYPDKDEVTYEGRPVTISSDKVYFIFNKPRGVVSTVKDTHGRKTVLDYFKDVNVRLYPVGRLDQDTTGLLLLTNDGDLANKLMHPRYGVEKVYEAKLDKEATKEQVEQLERGVMVEGSMTAPCRIHVLGAQDGNPRVEVFLHEGKKRQVRVMFQSVGVRVVHLHRKRYGPLVLKGLTPGKYRALTQAEVETLKRAVRGQTSSE